MKLKYEVEIDIETDAPEQAVKDEIADYIKVGIEDFSLQDTNADEFEVIAVEVTSK